MRIIDISEVLLELGLSASVTDEERAIVNTAIVRVEGLVKRFLHYDPSRRSRTEYYPQQDRTYTTREAVWEASDDEAYVRRLSEAATDELQVQHVPIRSDPAIVLHLDYDGRSGTRAGSFGASTLQTEGEDYWPNYDGVDGDDNRICRDGIIRSLGSWPATAGCVQIVYTAGYTMEELHGQDAIVDASPIVDVAIEEACRKVKKAFVVWRKRAIGFVAGPFTSEKLGDYSYTLDSSLSSTLFGGVWDLLPESQERLGSFVNYGWPLGG